MTQASLFDPPPRRSHPAPTVQKVGAAVSPQPPREVILPAPAGGWGVLNRGMALLPPVIAGAGCVHCARPVASAAPFVAVLTAKVETVTKGDRVFHNVIPALLHAACHPVWWAARCAAALAALEVSA